MFYYLKNHLGVLIDFKPISINDTSTSYKPLKILKKDLSITGNFDIEAFFDPDDELNQINIPYLCCFTHIINGKLTNIYDKEERDCVLYMLGSISDFSRNNKISNVELVTHKGVIMIFII